MLISKIEVHTNGGKVIGGCIFSRIDIKQIVLVREEPKEQENYWKVI